MKWIIACALVIGLGFGLAPHQQVFAQSRPSGAKPPTPKPTQPKPKPSLPATDLTGGATDAERFDPTPKPTASRPTPTPTPTSAEPEGAGLGGFISVFLSICALLFSAVTLWWLDRRLDGIEQRGTQQNQHSVKTLDEIFAQFDDLNRRLDENTRHVKASQIVCADLQTQMLELGDHVQMLKRNAGSNAAAPAARYREDVYESAPRAAAPLKPVVTTAAELLARARLQGVNAKAVVFRPEKLQRAHDGDGIYLVTPDERRRGSYVVLPNVPRFSSSQDYSYFSHFYECDHPAAGEIYITEPALASYDGARDEWTLSKKGRMQIG